MVSHSKPKNKTAKKETVEKISNDLSAQLLMQKVAPVTVNINRNFIRSNSNLSQKLHQWYQQHRRHRLQTRQPRMHRPLAPYPWCQARPPRQLHQLHQLHQRNLRKSSTTPSTTTEDNLSPMSLKTSRVNTSLTIRKQALTSFISAQTSKLHDRADALIDDDDEPMDQFNHQRSLTAEEMNDYNNELLGNDQGQEPQNSLMNRFITDSQNNINNLNISSSGKGSCKPA